MQHASETASNVTGYTPGTDSFQTGFVPFHRPKRADVGWLKERYPRLKSVAVTFAAHALRICNNGTTVRERHTSFSATLLARTGDKANGELSRRRRC